MLKKKLWRATEARIRLQFHTRDGILPTMYSREYYFSSSIWSTPKLSALHQSFLSLTWGSLVRTARRINTWSAKKNPSWMNLSPGSKISFKDCAQQKLGSFSHSALPSGNSLVSSLLVETHSLRDHPKLRGLFLKISLNPSLILFIGFLFSKD